MGVGECVLFIQAKLWVYKVCEVALACLLYGLCVAVAEVREARISVHDLRHAHFF